MNSRTAIGRGPGETAHIAHRVDGAGPMVQQTTVKHIGSDLFPGLICAQQIDRRTQPLPRLGAARQIGIALGGMGRVNGAALRRLALNLILLDEIEDVGRRLAENVDQTPSEVLAHSGPHILRR